MAERSDYTLRSLTSKSLLDELIYSLEKPLDGPAGFDAHVATQRSMGCSHIDGPYHKDGWIKCEQGSREKRHAELVQWRNELRGIEAAELMRDLGEDFHHFSIRPIDSRGHGPCTLEIYRKDSNGLNGFVHAGAAYDCPETRAAVGAGSNEYIGPRSGQLSGFRN